jgi:hypothetical protein
MNYVDRALVFVTRRLAAVWVVDGSWTRTVQVVCMVLQCYEAFLGHNDELLCLYVLCCIYSLIKFGLETVSISITLLTKRTNSLSWKNVTNICIRIDLVYAIDFAKFDYDRLQGCALGSSHILGVSLHFGSRSYQSFALPRMLWYCGFTTDNSICKNCDAFKPTRWYKPAMKNVTVMRQRKCLLEEPVVVDL